MISSRYHYSVTHYGRVKWPHTPRRLREAISAPRTAVPPLKAGSIISEPGPATRALNGCGNRLGWQNVFVKSSLPMVCYLHTTLLLPALYNKLNSDSIKNVCVMRRLVWKTPNIYLPSISTFFLQSRCFPRDSHVRECPGKWDFSHLELSAEYKGRKTEPLRPNSFSLWNLEARIPSSLREGNRLFRNLSLKIRAPSINAVIQLTFLESLLCAWLFSELWKYSDEPTK